MVHVQTVLFILNQLTLSTSCCPGDNLFSYNTKKKENTKIEKKKHKHQELADKYFKESHNHLMFRPV